jgi:hypothetical protein
MSDRRKYITIVENAQGSDQVEEGVGKKVAGAVGAAALGMAAAFSAPASQAASLSWEVRADIQRANDANGQLRACGMNFAAAKILDPATGERAMVGGQFGVDMLTVDGKKTPVVILKARVHMIDDDGQKSQYDPKQIFLIDGNTPITPAIVRATNDGMNVAFYKLSTPQVLSVLKTMADGPLRFSYGLPDGGTRVVNLTLPDSVSEQWGACMMDWIPRMQSEVGG